MEDEDYYDQTESPEIVRAFLDWLRSMPILNEDSDSVYSEEELNEF